MTADREVWLTPAQASRWAGVGTMTLRTWTRTRGLVCRRKGNGKREYLESSLGAILAEASAVQEAGPCS